MVMVSAILRCKTCFCRSFPSLKEGIKAKCEFSCFGGTGGRGRTWLPLECSTLAFNLCAFAMNGKHLFHFIIDCNHRERRRTRRRRGKERSGKNVWKLEEENKTKPRRRLWSPRLNLGLAIISYFVFTEFVFCRYHERNRNKNKRFKYKKKNQDSTHQFLTVQPTTPACL